MPNSLPSLISHHFLSLSLNFQGTLNDSHLLQLDWDGEEESSAC